MLLVAEGRATSTQLKVVSGRSAEIVIDNAELAFEPCAAEVQIRARPAPMVR